MDFSRKYTNLAKSDRLRVRPFIFPYVTKFMDRRLDSYLSLYYECELYSLEELKADLCDVIHVNRRFAVDVTIDRTPIYNQLTLF